eukprot:1908613-Alexandrium_andersonii.AAC.2
MRCEGVAKVSQRCCKGAAKVWQIGFPWRPGTGLRNRCLAPAPPLDLLANPFVNPLGRFSNAPSSPR